MKFIKTGNPSSTHIKLGSTIFEIKGVEKLTIWEDFILLKPIYTYRLKNIRTNEEFLIQQSDVEEEGFEYGFVEEV